MEWLVSRRMSRFNSGNDLLCYMLVYVLRNNYFSVWNTYFHIINIYHRCMTLGVIPCIIRMYFHISQSLYSLRRRRLIGIGILNINLRWSSHRHKFIMGIPIPVRRCLSVNNKHEMNARILMGNYAMPVTSWACFFVSCVILQLRMCLWYSDRLKMCVLSVTKS